MKISPKFIHEISTTAILKLSELFKANNFELRIAGGAVRDILMEIKPIDFDFATVATPSEMVEMFERNEIRLINANGQNHGTITARIEDQNFEVTTLRVDKETDGRRATVEFTENWRTDAERRDLTINSMFLDFDGNVFDYFNGIEDVAKRRVRFVNDPKKRIQEDYLRILRYFRFFGRVSTSSVHEVETLNAIRENVRGLEKISGERILSELEKLFKGSDRGILASVVHSMKECDLFSYLGLSTSQNLSEFDGFYARLLRSGNGEAKFGTFMSSLLPTLEDVGIFHKRTKMSNDCRNLCEFLVTYRGTFAEMPYKEIYDFLVQRKHTVKVYHEYLRQLGLYTGFCKKADEIIAWPVPKFYFPVDQLKSLGLSGKKTRAVVFSLKKSWMDNDYQMPTEQEVKKIVEAVLTDFS